MGFAGSLKSGLFAGVGTLERAMSRGVIARERLGEVRNFLLLQYPAALGTAVHATPVVAALGTAVPGCRIVVAASGFGVEVFRNNPRLERLIETPSPLKDWKTAARLLREAKLFGGESYATLTTTGNERTFVALVALLSGPSARVGFTLVPEIYRTPLEFDRGLSQIANNLRLVEALGHRAGTQEPEIFLTDADMTYARETLAAAGVATGQFVAVFVTQTSVTQRKSWRPERFRAVAEFLRERYGAHVLFVGTAAEAAAIEDLRGGLNFTTTSVAGKTSLTQLAALMRLCNVGLTLDTGPMHLGRAVGLPMVIVAPAWSPPIEWLPVENDRFRILKNLDMATAPIDYVIDEVAVEEVEAALVELIAAHPRAGFAMS